MLLGLLLLALALPCAAEEPLFETLVQRVILPASFVPVSSPQSKTPPMTLLVEQGSGFETPGRLERMLGKASAIFAPCGVALGAVDVRVVRWSAEALRLLNLENPYAGPSGLRVIADPGMPTQRPLGFLFGARSIPSTASAYTVSSGVTFGRFPNMPKLVNTWWLTMDQESRPPRFDQAPSYSITAHELAHLFGNLGHVDFAPNLMSNAETREAKSGDLDAAQCAAIAVLHGLPGLGRRLPSHRSPITLE